MKQIIFVTGNSYKFEIAQKVLKNTGIELIQHKIETPEIQSAQVKEIASYSAKFAAKKLGKPVVLTDAGYYIEALNGFPGPFIKYINQWLTPEDLLKLMEGKKNRTVIVQACLAYCEPNKNPITFESKIKGKIAHHAGKIVKGAWGSPINRIFIHEGFNKVESEIPRKEMVKFWSSVETFWGKLANYLSKK